MTSPVQRPDREEAALREIGQTAVSTAWARFTALLFLLTLFFVPLAQSGAEWLQYRRGLTDSPLPHALSIFPNITRSILSASLDAEPASEKLFSGNRLLISEMERFETQLEEQSFLTRHFLGPVQALLTRTLRAGNEQAYPGKHNWLFYRPDIDYVTQPWTEKSMASPLSAILDFHRQLRDKGITLVVMPTPVKPTVHPDFFSGTYTSASPPLHNAAYPSFVRELEAQGVIVFDPTEILARRKVPAYLETDTHWTFEAMEAVAEEAAAYLNNAAMLSPRPDLFNRTEVAVTNQGDIASMLKLPPGSKLYPPQVQSLQQVLTPQHELWKPDPGAEVLLLGDSFSNIFSLEGMGWGESAGFAEQLSFHLKQPVDAILQNDAGAHATRQKLSTELGKGRNRLAGKKVVLWQFAVRELTHGAWPALPLTLGTPRPSSFYVPDTEKPLTAAGVVAAISSSPKPGTVPYKDSIVTLHIVDLIIPGVGNLQESVVYTWGMRTNRLTQAARLRPGDSIEVELSPWSEVDESYSSYRRTLLKDINLELEEPCWAHQIIRQN